MVAPITSLWQTVFQSSPVPEDGCNGVPLSAMAQVALVSILTRPGGRVQLSACIARVGAKRFQSSPVPEDGCNGVPCCVA